MAKENLSIPFTLVRRKGQKHINIRVHHDGQVTVSAPVHTSDARVNEAVTIKATWIRSHVNRVKEKISCVDELSEFPLGGAPHTVVIEYDPNRRGHIRLDESEQCIYMRTNTVNRRSRIDAMVRFLKRYCAEVITQELHRVSKPMRIEISRVFYRNQKTRWGSSSAKGNISLNFRVAMLPPEVRRYLLLHELVHQKHMNHSVSFWKHMQKVCPDYLESDRWLKEHSYYLGLFR